MAFYDAAGPTYGGSNVSQECAGRSGMSEDTVRIHDRRDPAGHDQRYQGDPSGVGPAGGFPLRPGPGLHAVPAVAPRVWRLLRTLINHDDAIAVVAREQLDVVGYAVGRITTLPSFFEHRYRGYIHDVFVKPEHRRRGIGR